MLKLASKVIRNLEQQQALIFLGLGSNLGNRFDNLQHALNYVFESVGRVQKISPVYESPAQGFEGPLFLNCVVSVFTHYKATKVLRLIKEIERKMGRESLATSGYSSRIIDIDLLAYNAQLKDTKALKLPHPSLANRDFVLAPWADIAPDWKHPETKQTVATLFEQLQQTQVMALEKQSKWLRNPIQDFKVQAYNYLVIEGSIGAGKTSLATQITSEIKGKLILERFKDNPFLPKFYKQPKRYAFALEMSFLADRYQQLLDDIHQLDLFKDCVVADYEAHKSLIFAGITLQKEEFTLYQKMFLLMHQNLPKPDKYVFLYQDVKKLLAQIEKRGRSFEKDIKPDYLEKIQQAYLAYIKTLPPEKVQIIDVSALDFVKNRADYIQIFKALF